jgi:glucose-1-phosphate cytidylyltransferase
MPAVTDRSSTPVVILCGGRGTRLQEHVREIPKPLVEIGGLPIVWHVIQLYAVQGFSRFILATGYQAELVSGFVDARRWPDGVQVRCVDTGPDTPTGGRIQRLAGHLDGERFAATYADGLADVDLRELERHHREHGGLATMTVVRPELQFGVTELQDGGSRVVGFHEKPRLQQWRRPRSTTWGPTACSSASRWSAWPTTASCTPTATPASGSAWTPTRTRSR